VCVCGRDTNTLRLQLVSHNGPRMTPYGPLMDPLCLSPRAERRKRKRESDSESDSDRDAEDREKEKEKEKGKEWDRERKKHGITIVRNFWDAFADDLDDSIRF
jgi:hypothetical protein